MVDLVHFAAQAEDDRGRNVRMHEHAAEGAAELVDIGPMAWPQPSPWGNATTPSTPGGRCSPS